MIKKIPQKLFTVLFRPHGVTWYSKKETLNDALKVVVFSGVSAILLIACDLLFGEALGALLV